MEFYEVKEPPKEEQEEEETTQEVREPITENQIFSTPQVKEVKPKKKVSQKQLEHLAKARVKAAETRRASKGKRVTIPKEQLQEPTLQRTFSRSQETYTPSKKEQEDFINQLVEKKLREKEELKERKKLQEEKRKEELREAFEAGRLAGSKQKETQVKENLKTFKQTWGNRFI